MTAVLSVEFRQEDLTVQLENGLTFNIFEIIGKLMEIGKCVSQLVSNCRVYQSREAINLGISESRALVIFSI